LASVSVVEVRLAAHVGIALVDAGADGVHVDLHRALGRLRLGRIDGELTLQTGVGGVTHDGLERRVALERGVGVARQQLEADGLGRGRRRQRRGGDHGQPAQH
jgi:hypothetical protein